ncbi:C13 family peptidase [Oleiagrimonas sp. MCCC 1A03011]|uniref:C13 family peptidase n=1 Tax=Oleiagrimonas sp. MCCC 1A03011 TaxID=1926883 RepID=UPI000DC4423A|nr:C13 family peptidase [Oleiagrimonas sp. MCCC 1A03011]RAP56344.1 peptidase C13 [Oleiagrimonas sp. MCCC 1A03011]
MRMRLRGLLIGAVGALLAVGASHLITRALAQTPAPPKPAQTAPASAPDPWAHWPENGPTPEQVMYAQPRLMRQAIARLKPQDPHKIDLYLIAFAGDGSENVFRNEAEYAARLFARRFDADGHTLVLENNPATLQHAPLATWSNLEQALAAVHRVMDPKQDILVLYLTSHGSADHYLLVDMDPMPLDQIGAKDLAGILAEHPFRWKVVVVNACYSGGFVPPLKGPGTLVMTAARKDRSSFGCGSESDITYFGDAFLAHALNRTDNLIAAFGMARKRIASWEKRDGLTPSDPQIEADAGIRARLAAWRSQIRVGKPLAFAPAGSARATCDHHDACRNAEPGLR